MNYINLDKILALHNHIIQTSGGSEGIRNQGGLESAIAQPLMTFGRQDLYPTVIEKATALCFSLIQNHPFVDGNKRVGHAAMAVFLRSNGYRIDATVDMQEQIILGVASGEVSREQLAEWLREHICELI